MADISAKEVMALRQRTGLSMMECKKALKETGGDAQAAEDFLRKKLKGKMETRTDRAAGEGRIGISVAEDGSAAAIVELRAETDFTAKNDAFASATEAVAALALKQAEGDVTPTDEMKAAIEELKISTGENISIARVHTMAGGAGVRFGTYVHHDFKTGALVRCDASVAAEAARQVCIHITAADPRPLGVTADDIPSEFIENERRLALEMAKESGKNDEIAQKMVEGKISKLYKDLALVAQPFVMDPDKTVADLVGGDDKISAFRRWQVGQQA